MRKHMQSSSWSTMLAGLSSICLIILLTACGGSPSATPQAETTPRVTTSPSTGAASPPPTQITPSPSPTSPFLTGDWPYPRDLPQLAYDRQNNTLVLFGGKSFNGVLQDTWTWDGHVWTEQHPAASPGSVLGASMAYDDATGLVVLFGGCLIGCNQATNAMWSWNGATWTQLHPAITPSPRMNPDMVYDAARGQLLLFGGLSDTNTPLNDTWSWNGTTWTQLHPATAPSARSDASIAYDATTRTVVLFGGDDNSAPIPLLNDTWSWNGATWTQQHPATAPPGGAFNSNGTIYGAYPTQNSMVWDAATQQLLLALAGGDNTGQHKIQITWSWDGTTWTQQAMQHLPEEELDVFYSAAQRTIYAFASFIETGTFNDSMCQWTGQAWQILPD